MPYQSSNGIRIYYEIHGKGEPLILIGGLGGDRTFWQPHVETLSLPYKVIVFDTRGIGRTDAPREPYNLEMFAIRFFISFWERNRMAGTAGGYVEARQSLVLFA